MTEPEPKSLYVHIPYCRTICPYCDFSKVHASTNNAELYIGALMAEGMRYSKHSFDTIYIGGGTPSVLSLNMVKTLLTGLKYNFGEAKETTFECNPEDVTPELAVVLVENGVNRISLGVQCADNRLLRLLGRRHSIQQAERAIANLREAGITNINADFIYGIPRETADTVRMDLDFVQRNNLPHCSFYSLQIEPHTLFANSGMKERDPDYLKADYDTIVEFLKKIGLERYEVSNFAKPGFESQHNLTYWRALPYAAIGLGATSYVAGVREVRTRSMKEYLKGNFIRRREEVGPADQEFEYLMLNLRLRDGFSLDEFKDRFGKDFLNSYASNLKKVEGQLKIDSGRVSVLPEKLYILDAILVDLLNFSGVH